MARVLFAWEFGGDLGHVRRLVPIATRLRAAGHEAAFAFRDVAALAQAGFPAFAAPRLAMPTHPNPSPLNASDILLNLGFADAAALAAALRAWQSLFTLWAPDLLVADYAPSAVLGARTARLPRVTIGSGFWVPPPGDPLPPLRAWLPRDDARLRALDARLVEAVRRAYDLLGAGAAPRDAASIFAADANLLCTYPQLDPFGRREGVEYLGPQDEPPTQDALAWRERVTPRVFAYLKPRDPRFGAVVEALRRVGGDAIVAAPGLDEAAARALTSGPLRVTTQPANLARLLPRADLCVTHAGPGVAAHALEAGVPLALLPQQLEQYLVARRLVEAGVAAALAPEEPLPALDAWLHALAHDEALRARARALAQRTQFPRIDAAQRIAERLGSA